MDDSVKLQIERVFNFSTRQERNSWNRKRSNMGELVQRLGGFEDQMIELQIQMQPIRDEIAELRKLMKESCIHPVDLLAQDPTTGAFVCKFCERKFTFPTKVTLEDVQSQVEQDTNGANKE